MLFKVLVGQLEDGKFELTFENGDRLSKGENVSLQQNPYGESNTGGGGGLLRAAVGITSGPLFIKQSLIITINIDFSVYRETIASFFIYIERESRKTTLFSLEVYDIEFNRRK